MGTLLAHPALSDELRPGYLELRQTTSDTYNLLFKIPARGDELRLGIYVKLPEGAHDVAAPRSTFNGGAYIERRSIRRDGGLTGHTIAIEGLSATSTDVLVRIEGLGGATQTERLSPRTQRSSSRPLQAHRKSPPHICALASNISCSASITFCSSLPWSSWFESGDASPSR